MTGEGNPTMPTLAVVVARALLAAMTLVLAGCPAKDEKGLDFAKTQREALDKAKAVEQTVLDAAAKRGDAAEKP
jgi:hypothetical protein